MNIFWFVLTENVRRVVFWRAIFSEFLATAILVFLGCGSIVLQLNDEAPVSPATTVRVALAFGFAINILIKTFGPVSGCHINPAVSIAFMIVGKVSLVRAVIYTVAQLAGAIIGAGLLYGVLPPEFRLTLGGTHLRNNLTPAQGFATEAILTFILVLAISACLDEKRIDHFKMKITNPLTIGLTVSALHLVGIPFTGTGINPARSLGPAVITSHWEHHWIFWVGPIFGACISTITYQILFVLKPKSLLAKNGDVNNPLAAPGEGGETPPPSISGESNNNANTRNNNHNNLSNIGYDRSISVLSNTNFDLIDIPLESYNVAAVSPIMKARLQHIVSDVGKVASSSRSTSNETTKADCTLQIV